MDNFRERFTKWYYRKGYKMEYRKPAELVFRCPTLVRLLVSVLFSPSVYYHEQGYDFCKEFEEGLVAAIKLGL